MELITESNELFESPVPMWMNYTDAFTKFVEQSMKRLDRYKTYEEMDKYPEIHFALDIISTELFSFDVSTKSPFEIDTYGKVSENILNKLLINFNETFKLKTILPYAIRNSLKFGDAFYFVLKKEGKMSGLRKIENKDIEFIEYDEVGVEPLNYYINKTKLETERMTSYLNFLKSQNLKTTAEQENLLFGNDGDEYYVIPADRILRFMNGGQNSRFFPFGESYLEPIFYYWKKITLLEDSLIIYRIVRAPERRVFYVDVGKAPAKVAEKVLKQTKEEIKRRRVAASQESKELGIASAFNPLSMQEDYFFAQRADGRGSRVETLPGASNLGEISDVNYFYKKLLTVLKVPISYFNTENQATINDGKIGQALAEEARFGKWLSEIREQFTPQFKLLFKNYLKENGIILKMQDFVLRWRETINVEENKEIEKMMQVQSVYSGFNEEHFSPLYLQKKILRWSEEEIQENITKLKKWKKLKSNMESAGGDDGF